MNNSSQTSDIQKQINRCWVDYDQYDRNTWPKIQDGSRLALVETEQKELSFAVFYYDDFGPRFSGNILNRHDVVVRYADGEAFQYKELIK